MHTQRFHNRLVILLRWRRRWYGRDQMVLSQTETPLESRR